MFHAVNPVRRALLGALLREGSPRQGLQPFPNRWHRRRPFVLDVAVEVRVGHEH